MPLYDPIAAPRLSRQEFDYNSVTRPTGFGEYMGSALRQGWDVSGLGAFVRDPFGASERFGPLPTGQDLETSKAMGFDVDLPRLTEEQWKKAGLARDGLAYEGGTLDHERSRTDEFDRKRYHDSVVARYQGNALAYAAGFGARVLGGGVSPENFVPFVGPGMRAAMVARLGVIGGRAAVGAVDNVIGTALTDAYVMPQMAREGETVTAGDLAMDLTLGAVAGTVLGSAGGWVERRRAAANAIRTPGVEPMADALDRAVEAIDTGQPVDVGGYIRSTDVVQRIQRMAPELAGGPDLPEIRAEARARATATETIGRAEFVAGHEADGALDLPKAAATLTERIGKALDAGAQVTLVVDGKPVPITSISGGMMTDASGQRWGTATLATSTGPENSVRIEAGAPAVPSGRVIARTIDEPLEGGGRHQRYEVSEGDRPIAAALVGVHGDTAIVGAIGSADSSVSVAQLGHRQLRELAAAVKRDNPEVQWLEGERVTGVRKGTEAGRGKARVAIDQLIGTPRQPDLTTTATPEPPEPSVLAAEKSYKAAPADFTQEQAARIKESGLDAETFARDQAVIQQARKQGALTPAQEAELEAADLAAKQHEDEAASYQALALCTSRYD